MKIKRICILITEDQLNRLNKILDDAGITQQRSATFRAALDMYLNYLEEKK